MFICPSCKNAYDAGEAFCPEDGTRLVTQSQIASHPIANDPLVGAVLAGRWKLIKPIGSGGMGVVYEAHHATLSKRRAIKVLREQVSRDADVVQRFQREAQSASRIGHENIIEIVDFGFTPGGASYMVMELLEGRDLSDVLVQYGAMKIDRALPILLQCCRALGAAHAKGIVHRDMKPENVFLVERDGERDFVKIVDFGIAKISDLDAPGPAGRKLTKTGMIFGTPEYMSTEQAYGRTTDARSDIYGLGVIGYEMLTGRVPFEGETFMAVISQHMLDPAPPMAQKNPAVRIPAELEAIIVRTMEKEPAARFQSMAELHDALLSFMHRSDLTSAVPSRLADVSFSAPLPRPPSGAEEGTPVEARPTPRREELASPGGGALKLDDEPERPPSIRTGPPWGALIALALVVLGATAAVAVFRPDVLGLTDEEEPTDPAAIVGVEPINDTVPADDGGVQVATTVEDGMVEVVIATDPAGATVDIDGEAGCTSTPCVVRLAPDESVTVTAQHGGRTVSEQYTPTLEGGELTLDLGAPRPRRPPPRMSMRRTEMLPTEGRMGTASELLRWDESSM